MSKKSFLAGSIIGAGLTALSVLLFAPQSGEDLKDEINFEVEEIKENITKITPKDHDKTN